MRTHICANSVVVNTRVLVPAFIPNISRTYQNGALPPEKHSCLVTINTQEFAYIFLCRAVCFEWALGLHETLSLTVMHSFRGTQAFAGGHGPVFLSPFHAVHCLQLTT